MSALTVLPSVKVQKNLVTPVILAFERKNEKTTGLLLMLFFTYGKAVALDKQLQVLIGSTEGEGNGYTKW